MVWWCVSLCWCVWCGVCLVVCGGVWCMCVSWCVVVVCGQGVSRCLAWSCSSCLALSAGAVEANRGVGTLCRGGRDVSGGERQATDTGTRQRPVGGEDGGHGGAAPQRHHALSRRPAAAGSMDDQGHRGRRLLARWTTSRHRHRRHTQPTHRHWSSPHRTACRNRRCARWMSRGHTHLTHCTHLTCLSHATCTHLIHMLAHLASHGVCQDASALFTVVDQTQ
mmetsp:Transcript_9907/g.21089  ORF Transcript_9907/g.21089 Transcript_9907/m.21089 type:complete len:222 (-) Transcript_9907:64-729(-)